MFGRQLVVCFLWMGLAATEGARILAVFPFDSPSQCVFLTPYLRALAERHHQLTVIHAYPQCDAVQSIHYIQIKDAHNVTEYDLPAELVAPFASQWSGLTLFRNFVIKVSLNILQNVEVQELMHSNGSYDLMVVEPTATNALFGLAAHFNATLMGLATCGSDWTFDELVGYASSVFDPMMPLGYKHGSSWFNRMYNWAHISEEWLVMKLMFWPKLQQLFEQYFPHVALSFDELIHSFSLVLLNQHFSLCRARPNVPGLVDVAGLHVPQQTPQLPAVLAQFIEQAQHGVIYFALGWEMQSKDLPAETVDLLIKVFEALPQRILWKYEGKPMHNLSSNIYIRPWLPQQAILAHPNVKLFITHGGTLSVIEAAHYGIPVLGLPLFFDQFRNIDCLVEGNMALELDLNALTRPALMMALEKLLKEPKYKQNALELSSRFRDRPMHPLETAVYWTEYVLRYKGAPQMRVRSNFIKFMDYYSLDMILMVVGRLAIIVFIVVVALYQLKRFVLSSWRFFRFQQPQRLLMLK